MKIHFKIFIFAIATISLFIFKADFVKADSGGQIKIVLNIGEELINTDFGINQVIFSGSGNELESTSLDASGSYSITSVGWPLFATSGCDYGSPPPQLDSATSKILSGIKARPGGITTCTLNINTTGTNFPGGLVVEMNTTGGTDNTFEYSVTPGPSTVNVPISGSPNGTGASELLTLSPGSGYSISPMALPPGWLLDSDNPPTCNDYNGGTPSSFKITAGQTTVCKFNIGYYALTIHKITDGSNDKFDFTVSGPGSPLVDRHGDSPNATTSNDYSDDTITLGNYTISENSKFGWGQNAADTAYCTITNSDGSTTINNTDPTSGLASFTVAANQQVTCTFHNNYIGLPPTTSSIPDCPTDPTTAPDNSDAMQEFGDNMVAGTVAPQSVYYLYVTGTTDGPGWGNNDNGYGYISDLNTMAVHSGAIIPGETAIVKVTLLPGQSSYTGTSIATAGGIPVTTFSLPVSQPASYQISTNTADIKVCSLPVTAVPSSPNLTIHVTTSNEDNANFNFTILGSDGSTVSQTVSTIGDYNTSVDPTLQYTISEDPTLGWTLDQNTDLTYCTDGVNPPFSPSSITFDPTQTDQHITCNFVNDVGDSDSYQADGGDWPIPYYFFGLQN